MNSSPKISVVVPIHDMPNGAFFLWRLVNSLMSQTFKDYELIIVKEGLMAENTNAGILKARGELVKILFMDDYFARADSLQEIVDKFEGRWMVTGCVHDMGDGLYKNAHYSEYTQDISTGNNCIGSPSVLTFRREGCLMFDENLSYMLDCDLYKRYYDTYGLPKILNDLNVVIGLHDNQTSNLMTHEQIFSEREYVNKKHA